ncbi:LamG-like jellyroll fold domain-containing protein [Streptomyces sp. NPDC042319]|uniref:LamG-like jellyroll fold domain-containing protein n=1 Tax=Streptomyces sp. NPDC042319 TaxID=3154332 RepID=UPI00340C6E84
MSAYDDIVLSDTPVLYLPLGGREKETSLAGHLTAAYHGTPGTGPLPNGDTASVFDGTPAEYVEVPDDDSLSVPTTGILTIEAWMRPDSLTPPNVESSGYVHWLGKITYGGGDNREWAARMYSLDNTEGRANRISGYAFNRKGGEGVGSYFQDPVEVGEWIYYVLVINTVVRDAPYPMGYTKIFKNGDQRDQDSLATLTIEPANTTSPMRIATAGLRSFFPGGIGKVAVYAYELPGDRIAAHYNAMTT